jgi:predicted phage-related endonuclease
MSLEMQSGVIEFDENTVSWVEQYRNCLIRIKEWQESADIARSNIEASMGNSELAFFKGQPLVRWTVVMTKRFDVKKAKEILPEELVEKLSIETQSRRFTLVAEGEE